MLVCPGQRYGDLTHHSFRTVFKTLIHILGPTCPSPQQSQLLRPPAHLLPYVSNNDDPSIIIYHWSLGGHRVVTSTDD